MTQSTAWQALQAHYEHTRQITLNQRFDDDPARAQKYQHRACGINLDLSKNHIDARTIELLLALAEQQALIQKRSALFSGAKINVSEQRAALHTALRSSQTSLVLDGKNIMPAIHATLDKMDRFVQAIRGGRYRTSKNHPIRSVVNLGIGGSNVGPQMATEALQAFGQIHGPQVSFVSNVDATLFIEVTEPLKAETTLFIASSKSFNTRETLLNLELAKQWLRQNGVAEEDLSRHFVAATANLEAARNKGIKDDNIFELWDWVGGRYSLCSAIGLPLALSVGMPHFRDLLRGAQAMDKHFLHTPLDHNLPVLLGLISVWYNNFFHFHQHLILNYDYPLKNFAAHIQQLDMESNGKSHDLYGRLVDYPTGMTIWGGLANNVQHSYMQALHQGSHPIPIDFIGTLKRPNLPHRHALAASCIAQSEALMRGQKNTIAAGTSTPGNRPSNTLLLEELTPYTLGALVALYEHKTFVQSALWDINAFDQPSVELHKQLAQRMEEKLLSPHNTANVDNSARQSFDLFRTVI